MSILSLVDSPTTHLPRAYVNSVVRFHHLFTLEERLEAAKKAGWNVFSFPSEMLQGGDLLSDSGTTTLTAEQIAATFLSDEAYGSNYGYFELLQSFENTFGISMEENEFFLFHQGRAAEHALFTQIGKIGENLIIPSNGHFDTTHANIENNCIRAINLFDPHLKDPGYFAFKGNMDTNALESLLKTSAKHIPVVYLTVTNNTGGGQPVSMENIRTVKKICDKYKKSLFLDACRFAENAYFIKQREPEFKNTSVAEIVQEMFGYCDGFTISLKKDGLSNMGGALVMRKNAKLLSSHKEMPNKIRDHQILVEGHPTYGGLSGRDIMVIKEGLKLVIQEEYLHYRIEQVRAFGAYLQKNDIPVLAPFGGHAIYIDVDKFFEGTNMKREDFGGISLTALLLLRGVRLCELGAFAFGKYNAETKQEDFPPNNFVRCAIPRNKYELSDLLYVADCIIDLHKKRKILPKAVPIYGRELSLRHFKAKFKLKD